MGDEEARRTFMARLDVWRGRGMRWPRRVHGGPCALFVLGRVTVVLVINIDLEFF